MAMDYNMLEQLLEKRKKILAEIRRIEAEIKCFCLEYKVITAFNKKYKSNLKCKAKKVVS